MFLLEDDVARALAAHLRDDGARRLAFDGDAAALPAGKAMGVGMEWERSSGAIGDGDEHDRG